MEAGSAFFEQFIDDYFAECEEHLATIRRILLQMESDGGVLGSEDAQEIARALHTVKGLSGMVGLAAAESISHAMEDAVAAVVASARGDKGLTELLFEGASLLEDRIGGRKERRPAEGADDYLRRIAERVGPSVARPAADAADVAPAATKQLKVTFTPSRELAQRGVTIETVRSRLGKLGEITNAAPRVAPGGGVYFEFMVSLDEQAMPDDAWLADGIGWTAAPELPSSLIPFAADTGGRESRPAAVPAGNLVRVDLTRLDESMRLVGELVVSRSRLQESIDRLAGQVGDAALEPISAAAEAIERQLRALREGIMRIRLVPIGEVFERMRFAMRDIAREHGKIIQLDFEGGETELDKVVIDRIIEPLMHLVRNAASHGIEGPAERSARGKSTTGHLTLRARAAGDRIVIEVEDDGAGINLERVERQAHERGLLPRNVPLEPSTVLDVITAPGFSTRDAADMASGRGVGMGVVLSTIRGLGGELTVTSDAGAGTHFTIELPLTLMITDALLVDVAGETMAVPQILLREILPLADHPMTVLENNSVITYRETVLPLVDLRAFFGAASEVPGSHVLVVGADGSLQGLVVDRVIGLREIVVQPVADPYLSVPGIAGATELADGRVSLILDAGAIVRNHRQRRSGLKRIGAPGSANAIGSGQ